MRFPNRLLKLFCLVIALLAASLVFPVIETKAEENTAIPSFDPDDPSPEPESSLTSFMTIDPLLVQPVGHRVTVNTLLTNIKGLGVPNKPVILYVNGKRVRRARTDSKGAAAINIGKTWPVGEYHIDTVFAGTEAYRSSAATATLTIRPLELVIETLPSLTGMRFEIGDQIVETKADGQVQVQIDTPGTYTVKALLPVFDETQTDTLYTFDRWGDAVFTAEREVVVNQDIRLQTGFALSYRASQQFVDLDGNEVADSHIDSLTLKSSYGSIHTFEDGSPRWLQANRIARRANGLEVTPVQYSVESVMIDGANVVNRYQQRFFLKQEDTWTIELLLYYARITTKDFFFGFQLGKGVRVVYPNGRIEYHFFGEGNEIFLGPLARGTYKLQVSGVKGVATVTPVALSRDQVIVLKVLSALDLVVGIMFGVAVGLGLLFYGRPQLLHLPKDVVLATGQLSRGVLPKLDEKLSNRLITMITPLLSNSNGRNLSETRLISKALKVYGWHACSRTKVYKAPQKHKRRWKVTPAYLATLDETLAKEPEAYGCDFAIWTRSRLRDHLEQQTNIHISINWLGILLKERGYVFRRPKQIESKY